MCEDSDDRLPPMERWHEVRDPVPVIEDIGWTDSSRYGKNDPGENKHWQEGYRDEGSCDIENWSRDQYMFPCDWR